MKPRLATGCVVALGLLLGLLGCSKPAQLGGLGVFNPRGLEGRLALADRVNGSAAKPEPSSEPTADSPASTGKQPQD